MAFPAILRRLFANLGAGPLLRKEIIPFGTTEGTVCKGNDARLADWDAARNELKYEIDKLKALRWQSIGVPKFWTSTTLPDADHCWPDGSLVSFADYPELKAKYDAGGFAGMLLPAGSSTAVITANLGKWIEHPQGLGLYTPQLSGQFLRAWLGAYAEKAGAYNPEGLPDINGSYYVRATMGSEPSIFYPSGAFKETEIVASDGIAAVQFTNQYTIQACTFDAARSNAIYGANASVMPQSINMPVILYLGVHA